jgi:hypothetical protein
MTQRWFNEHLLLMLALIVIGAFSLCLLLPALQGYLPTISTLSFSLVGLSALILGSVGCLMTYRQGF